MARTTSVHRIPLRASFITSPSSQDQITFANDTSAPSDPNTNPSTAARAFSSTEKTESFNANDSAPNSTKAKKVQNPNTTTTPGRFDGRLTLSMGGPEVSQELDLTWKVLVILLGALLFSTLMCAAAQSLTTLIPVVLILWFVFGGHRVLAPVAEKSATDAMDGAKDSIPIAYSHSSNLVVRIEANENTVDGKGKVVDWLIAFSNPLGNSQQICGAHSKSHGYTYWDCDDSLSARSIHTVSEQLMVEDVGVSAEASNIVLDEETATFLDSSPISAVFEEDDYRADLTTCVSGNGASSPMQFMRQFVDKKWYDVGPLNQATRDHFYSTKVQIFEKERDPDVGSNGTNVCPESAPGRSLDADIGDIDFMFYTLEPRLPAEILHFVDNGCDLEFQYRLRNRGTGENQFFDLFVWWWHKVLNPEGGYDARWADQDRKTRRYLPECPVDEQDQCGYYEAPHRPYLTKCEERFINRGSVEYGPYYKDPEDCELLLQLQADPAHAKLIAHDEFNAATRWICSLNEGEFLDPNASDPCACGQKALEVHRDYRNELEPSYSALNRGRLLFPFATLLDDEILARWEMKTRDYKIEPKITRQICALHELVSKNSFVLIDPSAAEPDERISDISAEGLKVSQVCKAFLDRQYPGPCEQDLMVCEECYDRQKEHEREMAGPDDLDVVAIDDSVDELYEEPLVVHNELYG